MLGKSLIGKNAEDRADRSDTISKTPCWDRRADG